MSFAIIAAVVSAAFAVVVLQRFWSSRQPAFAAWGAGLLIFALAAAAQAIGEASGFTQVTFRTFYLFGGVLGVAYLALGTAFLMLPRRAAWVVCLALLTTTIAAGVDALTVSVDVSKLTSSSGVLGDALPPASLLHIGAVILNIVGSLVLIGGSAWSAWRFARGRGKVDRLACNLLLTIGAFVIAAGFSAAKVRGVSLDVLGMYEAVGITIMFAGFLALGRVGRVGRDRASS